MACLKNHTKSAQSEQKKHRWKSSSHVFFVYIYLYIQKTCTYVCIEMYRDISFAYMPCEYISVWVTKALMWSWDSQARWGRTRRWGLTPRVYCGGILGLTSELYHVYCILHIYIYIASTLVHLYVHIYVHSGQWFVGVTNHNYWLKLAELCVYMKMRIHDILVIVIIRN